MMWLYVVFRDVDDGYIVEGIYSTRVKALKVAKCMVCAYVERWRIDVEGGEATTVNEGGNDGE